MTYSLRSQKVLEKISSYKELNEIKAEKEQVKKEREEGTTTDLLVSLYTLKGYLYTLKGYRLMDMDSFRKRIEELKAKVSNSRFVLLNCKDGLC